MQEFVAEHYLPAEVTQDAGYCAKAARAAADQLRSEGTRVHHVRSILIPEDETCIHLYRAASIEAVRVAAARASLRLDRLTQAVSGTGAPGNVTPF
ncbi:MAG TPA: nickel-binding protein [Acidimicrobiales bacterium]|nr:nickel-binding protein [Acidimicrobiales bacterium]